MIPRVSCATSGLLGLFCASLVFSGKADVLIDPHWADAAPVIDGIVSPGEWSSAVATPLAHGQMRSMNDGSFLYVLLDVVDDTSDEPPAHAGPSTGDSFVLAFDVDLNNAVTPNVDIIYDTCQDGQPFIKATYLSSFTFTGCQPVSAASLGQIGFGSTLNSATPHRFWEFRLPFAEIGVDPSTWTTSSGDVPKVRVNVATVSEVPAFSTAQPDSNLFPNFSNTFRLLLATFPSFPAGTTGPTFAGVGLIPSTYINSTGYANINIPGYYFAQDAPFGGKLNVFGHWNTLYSSLHARRYRVLYSKDGGPYSPLRQTWTNFRFDGTTWLATAIGPDSDNAYAVPPPSEIWYLPNLLISWQSGLFGDGTYNLKLELLNTGGHVLPSPPTNSLTLFIDNTAPVVAINNISYNGSSVCACAIVNQGDAPAGFSFDISVTDSHGALQGYSLAGIFGNNQGTGTIYSDTYSSGGVNLGVPFVSNHVNANGPAQWNGVSNLTVPDGALWRADTSCAYSFILGASSRVQNGYGLVFPSVTSHVSLTILLGSGAGSITSCP